MENTNNLNRKIKLLRKKRHLSQSELASKLGMSQRNISYLESDGATVTDQNIKLICHIFNIDENSFRDLESTDFTFTPEFESDEFTRCAAIIGEGECENFKKAIIKFAKLDEASQKIIDNYFCSIFESTKE